MSKSLEKTAADILAIFTKYATEGGDPKALELKELKKLFKNELTMFDDDTFDTLAKKIIHEDKSGSVDSQEFVTILFTIVSCTQGQGQGQCQQSKHCK